MELLLRNRDFRAHVGDVSSWRMWVNGLRRQCNILRTLAVAVCYCCPVQTRSCHATLIDTQLHSTMHMLAFC